MRIRNRGSWGKITGALLAAMVLVALSGCYPYYYDHHYGYGAKSYKRDYYGKRHYYSGGYYYQHRHHKRDRRKRYRHYHRHW